MFHTLINININFNIQKYAKLAKNPWKEPSGTEAATQKQTSKITQNDKVNDKLIGVVGKQVPPKNIAYCYGPPIIYFRMYVLIV